MTALEILRRARASISLPEKWTQGVEARNARGVEVNAESRSAVCWCAVGALRAANGGEFHVDAYDALVDATGCEFPSQFNDKRTHAEVLVAFDRAIARLQTESPRKR